MTESRAETPSIAAPSQSRVWLALGSLYWIWGSTYLAIRVALDGFPPLTLAALRFLIAGVLLLAWQRLRGAPMPTRQQWGASAIVGALLVGANTLVTIAELSVSSGLTAVAVGSVPLWIGVVSGLFGKWPARSEWLGLAVGFCGVALLNLGSGMRGAPLGAAMLLLSPLCWAFGSILSHRLRMPEGLTGTGALMLCGGLMDVVLAVVRGEHLTQAPSGRALIGLAWLVFAGSVVGYSAYTFLITRIRPTLATSYAYVNPVVAMALGALFLHEPISASALVAMGFILSGVALLARAKVTH